MNYIQLQMMRKQAGNSVEYPDPTSKDHVLIVPSDFQADGFFLPMPAMYQGKYRIPVKDYKAALEEAETLGVHPRDAKTVLQARERSLRLINRILPNDQVRKRLGAGWRYGIPVAGAAAGGALGGSIGALLGRKGKRRAPALIGAGLGALAGGIGGHVAVPYLAKSWYGGKALEASNKAFADLNNSPVEALLSR